MRCPDWPTLAARRDRDAEGELLWERARKHLEGCERCREAAYAAEPTLVFHRLPTLEPSARDVAAMRESVAAMRRAQPLVVPAAPQRRLPRWRRSPRLSRLLPSAATLRQAAATAAVLVAAVALYTLVDADGMNPTAPSAVETGSPTFEATPAETAPAETAPAETAPAETAPAGAALTEAAPAPAVVPAALAGVRDHLRVDIQVMRASKKALGNIPRYDSYQVLAEAGVTSREGEDMTFALGESFAVSFKTGTVLADGRLRLEGFQIETRAPAVKGRRLADPQQLLHATLTLRLDRPLTLVLAQDPAEEEALVVAITCRQESSPGP